MSKAKRPVGFKLPAEILIADTLAVQPQAWAVGDYIWTVLFADQNGLAFIHPGVRTQSYQDGEISPHFVIRTETGYRARLMSMPVRQILNFDSTKDKMTIPIEEVEL